MLTLWPLWMEKKYANFLFSSELSRHPVRALGGRRDLQPSYQDLMYNVMFSNLQVMN